jgi:Ser/Thr protein kinase RdoA (MazF antagonist)
MAAGSSPLLQGAPPAVSVAHAERVAFDIFGIGASAQSLGSHQDRNFLLTTADGPLLLKFSHPSTTVDELVAQNAAMEYIAQRATRIRIPGALPASDGQFVHVTQLDGLPVAVRLLRFVEGEPLSGDRYLGSTIIRAMGALAATVDLSLAELSAPALERAHQWDLRRAPEVLDALLPFVGDTDLRARLHSASREAMAILDATAAELPQQLIHGDLTDDNVVVLAGIDGIVDGIVDGIPDGVIDFGDLNYSWTVGELAVTISSLLHHHGGSVGSVMEAVAAYHSVRPLSRAEAEALWPLVVIRGAVLAASGHHVASTDSFNRYAAENLLHELVIVERATAVPIAVATALVLDTLGMSRSAAELPPNIALLPGLDPLSVATIDFSATSPLMDAGRWLDPAAEDDLAAEALEGHDAVATYYAQARLTRSVRHQADEPENVVLGIDVRIAGSQKVVAPFDGTVESTSEGLEIRGVGAVIVLRGIDSSVGSGDTVVAGQSLGTVTATLRVSANGDGLDGRGLDRRIHRPDTPDPGGARQFS